MEDLIEKLTAEVAVLISLQQITDAVADALDTSLTREEIAEFIFVPPNVIGDFGKVALYKAHVRELGDRITEFGFDPDKILDMTDAEMAAQAASEFRAADDSAAGYGTLGAFACAKLADIPESDFPYDSAREFYDDAIAGHPAAPTYDEFTRDIEKVESDLRMGVSHSAVTEPRESKMEELLASAPTVET